MKLFYWVLIVATFAVSAIRADLKESPSINEASSRCLAFLFNFTNSSIHDSDRTLEANNTLKYSSRNLNHLGDYNTCKGLITQKYNIITSAIDDYGLAVGFCGPSYCSTRQLQNSSELLIQTIKNLTGKDFSKNGIHVIDPSIRHIEKGFSFYFACIVLCALLLLVIGGTISARWSRIKKKVHSKNIQVDQESFNEALLANKETVNEVVSNETAELYLNKETKRNNNDFSKKKKSSSLLIKILECFDLKENFKTLMSNKVDPNHDTNLNIFNGIRAFAFGYVVYGHTLLSFTSSKNFAYIMMFLKSKWLLVLAGAFYAVDIFFYLSGFLTGFLLLSKLKKMPFGFKSYAQILFHRLIRLWPAYFITIIFFYKILVYYGNGALWFGFLDQARKCHGLIWKNLLFIDNVTIKDETNYCFIWGWYLACDLQTFLISPFVCWMYLKNKQRGQKVLWLLLIVSLTASFYESMETGTTFFLAPQLKGDHPNNYMLDYYMNPLVRMSPYLLGLSFGFTFREYKNGEYNYFQTLKNSKSKSLLSVFLGLVLILFIVFYPRTLQTGQKWTDGFAMTWNAFSKPLFGLAIFLLTAPGLVGNFKPFTRFMSNYYFTLISRISYPGYLIHYLFLFINVYDSDQFRGLNEGYAMRIALGLFFLACL